jgi:hypothetical protein
MSRKLLTFSNKYCKVFTKGGTMLKYTKTITRRDFLKVSLAGLAGITTLSPIISGCAALTSPPVRKVAKTVLQHFAEFIIIAGLRKASEYFDDWMAGLDSESQNTVNITNQKMENAGFIYYNTSVYYNNNVILYGVENTDAFNSCVPFYSDGISLVEGPALMGIALAGQYWQSSNVHPADGLIPLYPYQDDGSQFEKSFSKPYGWKTPAGELEMNYESDYANKKGLVSVVARENNGGILHGEDYQIDFV